jgi:tripartite-type tricarboxylate transporter receptor subunit TctC
VPGGSWFGLFAPKGTPVEIVQRIAAELERALGAPGAREAVLKFGQYPDFVGPAAFAARIRSDDTTYRDLIAQTGIKAE